MPREPDTKPIVAFAHVPHEPMGTLEKHLERAGLRWHVYELFKGMPDGIDWGETSGLVVMGGPMNVDQTDRFPFLAREVEWIREALAADLPVLGVCLGSQLIAKAAGAKVYPNDIKEIGWFDVELTPSAADDRLFSGAPDRPTVFQWHGDTFDLPEAATLLATGPRCRHQAYRLGEKAWGLQFHIEMTPAMVDIWFAVPENCVEVSALDDVDPQAICDAKVEKLAEMKELADVVLPRFAALCREHA